ncbi:LysM peptidoglycan-binding domain-containing protein [Lacrimispora saccharolytica]|uniref:Peptidoglycan-binding lysin domain protein n=1 Tax=Lacrimispora saccharolytica (strain ATCC 35040 / DSM 2544 / NRCC 2533 / WM1) TaxID=610130 RepID=D9R141_LACSW|nr:LysM peptidoglycan-binding domain-containing protein [Lacrimispora saccharolytica]ADL04588.1 Peptidoglycan-binding lysin domain protein [[Clostridium] saccharolyticum WM1]QRV21167.1 LysM peptidoglycan-binding domain-containing protein [Lacrimispora saccharolytica]
MLKQLIALSLVVFLGSHFFGHSIMNALAEETEAPAIEKYYTSIEIQKGDSLWSIAATYLENSGMTTAQYVKELKNMNGLKEDTIHSGQYLTVMYFAADTDGGGR